MKSPFTGKEMVRKVKKRSHTFRNESFDIAYQYYWDEDTGEEFVDTHLGDLNLRQVHDLYRAKHHLPFPEDIRSIREQYQLPATKMSEILGFGVNSYGNYERGEMPSLSNGKMIKLASDPKQFKKLVEQSESIPADRKKRILARVDQLLNEKRQHRNVRILENYLLHTKEVDEYSGFRKPEMKRITHLILFFADTLHPWKTQLNKLLFYADFLHFKNQGRSISGIRYRAIQNGPVPHNYDSLFEYLINNHWITITKIEFPNNFEGERFELAEDRTLDQSLFSEEEMITLESVAKHFEGITAQEISLRSHREEAWIKNHQDKKLIDYRYACYLREL